MGVKSNKETKNLYLLYGQIWPWVNILVLSPWKPDQDGTSAYPQAVAGWGKGGKEKRSPEWVNSGSKCLDLRKSPRWGLNRTKSPYFFFLQCGCISYDFTCMWNLRNKQAKGGKEREREANQETDASPEKKLMVIWGEVEGGMGEIGDGDEGGHLWWAPGVVWNCWTTKLCPWN